MTDALAISRPGFCAVVGRVALAMAQWRRIVGSILVWLAAITMSSAAEPPQIGDHVRVTLKESSDVTITGRVVVRAADGGLLVEAADGRYVTAPAKQLENTEVLAMEFQYLSGAELQTHLQQQLKGMKLTGTMQFHVSEHYVLATNGNVVFAEWSAEMLEKLHLAFFEFWKERGLELQPIKRPLLGIVLANQTDFAKYGTADGNLLAIKGHGYFSMTTNRMAYFDFLTSPKSAPLRTTADAMRRSSSNPAALTTVCHEGVHQLAYNSGLQQRYSDVPVWLSEGMATYFETIDLNSKEIPKSIGRINPARLKQFKQFVRQRKPTQTLQSLIESNERFAKPDEIPNSYAEAWALTSHLLKTQPEKYIAYLKVIQQKAVLDWGQPKDRVADFEAHFGSCAALQRELSR